MKKFFTSIALLAACAVGANAQKTVDLGFSITSPTELGVYANVASADSFNIKVNIKNNGTADVVPTDTIIVWQIGHAVNVNAQQFEWTGTALTGLSIASGATYEYSRFYTKNSGYINQDGDTVVYYFKDNDTNQLIVEGYGYEANGTLFNDAGVDNTNPDADGALTGNNTTGVRNYILGVVTSTKDVSVAKSEVLNVYPNPSNGIVNVDYNFANATEANVKVTNLLGQVVYTQELGKQAAGKQSFNINLTNLANGMYTIELYTNESRAINKMTIKK